MHRQISAALTSGALRSAELKQLRRSLLHVAHALSSLTAQWSVSIGLEAQLLRLLTLVDAEASASFSFPKHERTLKYAELVRPQVALDSLRAENYRYFEDFFFRSAHVGTEAWAFVIHEFIRHAMRIASLGQWREAALDVRMAARLLSYLGDHVYTLTNMNTKDYMLLKVFHFIHRHHDVNAVLCVFIMSMSYRVVTKLHETSCVFAA